MLNQPPLHHKRLTGGEVIWPGNPVGSTDGANVSISLGVPLPKGAAVGERPGTELGVGSGVALGVYIEDGFHIRCKFVRTAVSQYCCNHERLTGGKGNAVGLTDGAVVSISLGVPLSKPEGVAVGDGEGSGLSVGLVVGSSHSQLGNTNDGMLTEGLGNLNAGDNVRIDAGLKLFLLGVEGVGSKNGKGADDGPLAGAFGKGACAGLEKLGRLGRLPVGSKALGDDGLAGFGGQPGGRGIPGIVGLQSRASRLHLGWEDGSITIRQESKVL